MRGCGTGISQPREWGRGAGEALLPLADPPSIIVP